METIGGRAEHWRYKKAEWKKPAFAEFLPAPEHLTRSQRKIWEQRGYGLWVGEKIAILGEYHPLRNAEKELLKSRIAGFLMDFDQKYFTALSKGDTKRDDFDFICNDNTTRAVDRYQILFDLLAYVEDTLPNAREDLDNRLTETAGMFARDTMRPNSAGVNRDGILIGNLETNLGNIRDMNERLMRIVQFPSGVQGVIGPVHSHKK